MIRTFALLAAAVVLAGCESTKEMWGHLWSSGARATAQLEPTKGSNVRGTVNFVQTADRVRVSGTVSGLRPNSEVGFHIHEAGDCSSGDGMSAKGHFNPQGKPHGNPASSERHAGDMPMLQADASGNASISAELDIITVSPGPDSIVGKGLIVHVQPDDYKTQPTGNAGARSACGVIRAG
jgi:Cu-Zn family superoxide dismutase